MWILDCKVDCDKEVIKIVFRIIDFLNEEFKVYYE